MDEFEQTDDARGRLDRRTMLRRTAAGGALVWAVPAVLASPAGAQTTGTPAPCDGEVLTLFIKYEVEGAGFEAVGDAGDGNCLKEEKALVDDLAETCVVEEWLDHVFGQLVADVEFKDGDTSEGEVVTITLPAGFTTAQIRFTSKKQGQVCYDGVGLDSTSSSTSTTFTFALGVDNHGISHVEFAVQGCVSAEVLDRACS